MFQYYDWQATDINWESLNMNWEEVGILINDVFPNISVSPTGAFKINLKKLNKLPEEKKRKIIMIALKLDNKEYVEYKYADKKDINITTEHINLILNKVTKNINVEVKNVQ